MQLTRKHILRTWECKHFGPDSNGCRGREFLVRPIERQVLPMVQVLVVSLVLAVGVALALLVRRLHGGKIPRS